MKDSNAGKTVQPEMHEDLFGLISTWNPGRQVLTREKNPKITESLYLCINAEALFFPQT